MSKRSKKTELRLAEARAYVNSVCEHGSIESYKKAEFDKRKEEALKSIKSTKTAEDEKYVKVVVVKKEKGCFMVEADGVLLDKKFKSSTKASEWAARHTK